MKVKKPEANARANCPSGGHEFAMTVWRYARVMALAAKAEGLKRGEDEDAYDQTNKILETYLDLLKVPAPFPAGQGCPELLSILINVARLPTCSLR